MRKWWALFVTVVVVVNEAARYNEAEERMKRYFGEFSRKLHDGVMFKVINILSYKVTESVFAKLFNVHRQRRH